MTDPTAGDMAGQNSNLRRFRIQSRSGVEWLVRPDGTPFFSLGVCCVDQGIPREKADSANPAFAAWQHYSNSTEWAQATLARLTGWGFTTAAGWSDGASLRPVREINVAFTPVLHLGGSASGAPWLDMWDPNVEAKMEQIARPQLLAWRDEPRLLGYYSDNELGWWNADLMQLALKQPPGSGQRQRLLALLRERYHDHWSDLVKDFDPEGADSFPALDRGGFLFVRPGGNGFGILRAFAGVVAERYYSLVRAIIRKYDPRALILGDRYQSFYFPEVARACASGLDAVSSNLNAPWNDGSLPRFYLQTLRGLSGRPILISEFYVAARENSSGNKNSGEHFPVVATQAERAAAFRNTITSLARNPWVVGADWFQYYDEPTHGRADGEDFNFGLVDIHNRPYSGLVAVASDLGVQALHREAHPVRRNASSGIPPAPGSPLEPFLPAAALKHWDREQGFVEPSSEFPLADLYVCWDPAALYLGLYAQDVVESRAYRGERIPPEDRAEWAVAIDGASQPIRARIGAGLAPSVNSSDVPIRNLSGVYHNTRNIAAMKVPARSLGRDRLNPGDLITFHSTFVGHGRVEHVEWNGRFALERSSP